MTVDCPHWSGCGVKGGGCCALGKFGGKPSAGTCRLCMMQPTVSPQPSVGLGDTLEKVFKRLGVDRVARAVELLTRKPCGCKKRQAALNKIVPYK